MTNIDRLILEQLRNLSPAVQQVLIFAEFLELKDRQLEDGALLRAMQEAKDEQTLDLENAKLYLDSLSEPLL